MHSTSTSLSTMASRTRGPATCGHRLIGPSTPIWTLTANAPALRLISYLGQKNGAEQLTESLGRHVEWLPLACDPQIHARQEVPLTYSLSFVGNLIGCERVRLVEHLRSQFTDVHVGRHYFEEMAAVYSASRAVFNRSVVDDINMRVFEGLCSGSLLVTNDLSTNGQEELLQDGKHLVTYNGDDELLDKIRFYLKNDSGRERIAAAGCEE